MLPAAPVDGQECFYLADSAAGIVWHLKYRAGSASPYKWEYVGGASLSAEVLTGESTASGLFTALTTPGPSVTVPVAGDYEYEHDFQGSNDTTGGLAIQALKLGAAATSDDDSAVAATLNAAPTKGREVTGIAAGAVLTCQYRTNGTGTASFLRRWLRVRPVRVG